MKKNVEVLKVYAQYYQDYAKDNNIKGMQQALATIQEALVKQQFTLQEASEFFKQYILKK